ncbi:MAG: hemolysin family protein [Hyphomicrobiales bacterium]
MSHEKPFESKPGILQKLRRRFLKTSDLRESLETVIESHAEQSGGAAMADDARSMLGNLLGFSNLRVDDLMVPRADITALDETTSMLDVLGTFTEANHSRLPIYKETLDDVTGMIHVKDFLGWLATRGTARKGKSKTGGLSLPATELATPVKAHGTLLRDVLYVPPSMPASDLLLKMKSSHIHLAVVVDEYGGTDGLVSFEDLVEAIVGDIADEHDADDEADLIRKQGDDTYVADARINISTLDQMFGVDLLPADQEDEADTLGGLIFEMQGRVPTKGEVIVHGSGLEFEIMETDPRRVKKVRIHVKPKASAAEETAGD